MQATTVAKPYAALNDRELVTKIKSTSCKSAERDMRLVLYRRYDRFVHKHWHALSKDLNMSAAVQEVKDDFYNESYLVFDKALRAVSIAKIRNDEWKFLGYYGFYLTTLKNNYAKGVINKYNAETSLEVPGSNTSSRPVILSDLSEQGTVQSTEEEVIEKDHQTRFWKAVKSLKKELWDDQKIAIWDLRAKGESIKSVCDELNITTWIYNKLLKEMKEELEYEIEITP